MSMVESAIIFLPRPTTLIGAGSFTTLPLDVSRFGSFQLQLWRGPIRNGGSYLAYFEESLDTETWVLGPSTPAGFDPADAVTGGDPTFARPQLFSYAFRLRWFRMRFDLTGIGAPLAGPMVTTWAEGFLRDGGGGGAWSSGAPQPRLTAASSLVRPGGEVSAARAAAAPSLFGLTNQQVPYSPGSAMADSVAGSQSVLANYRSAK